MGRVRQAKSRFLEKLAHFVVQNPGNVLIVGAALSLVGLFLARGLEIRSDLADFLPESSPVIRSFRQIVEHFGTSDHLIIAIKGNGEDDADLREILADRLAEKLEASARIDYLDYRVDQETIELYRRSLLPYALVYLADSGLEEMENRLSDEGIREQIRENRRMLLSPASSVTKKLVRLDLLGFRTLFRHMVVGRGGKLQMNLRDGYLFSKDLGLLLIIAKPIRPAQDIPFTRALMAEVNLLAEESLAEIEDAGENLESVRIGMTGGYAFVVENEVILKKDIFFTLITAAVGITLLFLYAFRSVVAVLYVGVPLLAGLSWTAGFAALTVGNINLFTGASATVLIGLEVDFAIHLLNRYREERKLGLGVEKALVETLRNTGVGVLTAATTTILAFYSALAAEFHGLVQLGLICGTGMIFCLFANLILLPAILVLASRWNLEPKKERQPINFGLEWLAVRVTNHPGMVVASGIVLTLVLGRFALLTRMESSFADLKPPNSPAVLLQKEVVRGIGSPLVYSMVVNRGATEEEALRDAKLIADRLDQLVEKGVLVFFNSISTLIPPFDMQRRNLEWLNERTRKNPDGFDIGRIMGSLRASMQEEGFREDEKILQETREFLTSTLTISEPFGIRKMLNTPLGPRISRFVRESPTGFEVVTYAYQGGKNNVHKVNQDLREALASLPIETEVLGVGVLGQELRRLLKRDGVVVTLIAIVVVLFATYVDFRKWRYVFLASIPVAAGIVWTLGIMEVMSIPLNIVNIGMLPILVGIGVDDGIHIVHRFLEGRGRIVQIFHNTGRAVLITTLTTIVGFGTLVFAEYPGLVTAGLVAIIGMVCCFVSSVTVLPALLWFSRRQRPAPTS